MGYRLEIIEIDNNDKEIRSIYASKLFGYTPAIKLKCYYWLKDNKFLEQYYDKEVVDTDTCFWGYGIEPIFKLTASQFIEFMKLYEEDYEKHRGYLYTDCLYYEENEVYKEILESNNNKMITWW